MACTVLLSRVILMSLCLVGFGLAQSETDEISSELPFYNSENERFCPGPDTTIDICDVWYYGDSEFSLPFLSTICCYGNHHVFCRFGII